MLGLLVYVHTCGLCVEIRVLQLDAISHRKGKIGLTRRYPIRLDPNGVGFTQPAKQMGRVSVLETQSCSRFRLSVGIMHTHPELDPYTYIILKNFKNPKYKYCTNFLISLFSFPYP